METCSDRIKNQDETGIDCGGNSCPSCNNTVTCKNDSDCGRNICRNNTCVGESLYFVISNVTNSLIQSLQLAMIEWKIKMKRILTVVVTHVRNVSIQWLVWMIRIVSEIFVRIINVSVSFQSMSISRNNTSSIVAIVACDDNIRNQDETDIDCGGVLCPRCNNTRICRTNNDCISGFCDPNHVCTGQYWLRVRACVCFYYWISHFILRKIIESES